MSLHIAGRLTKQTRTTGSPYNLVWVWPSTLAQGTRTCHTTCPHNTISTVVRESAQPSWLNTQKESTWHGARLEIHGWRLVREADISSHHTCNWCKADQVFLAQCFRVLQLQRVSTYTLCHGELRLQIHVHRFDAQIYNNSDRVLLTTMDQEPDTVRLIVTTCCLLHNLMRTRYAQLQNRVLNREGPNLGSSLVNGTG